MQEIIKRIQDANGLAYAEISYETEHGSKIVGDLSDNIEFYILFDGDENFDGGMYDDYDNPENTAVINSVDHLIDLIKE